MVEVLEVKQGVWIDATLLKLAGLGTRRRILTQSGEIRELVMFTVVTG